LIDFDFSKEIKDIRLFSRTVPAALVLLGTLLWIFKLDFWPTVFWIYLAAVAVFLWGLIHPESLKPVYCAWSYFTRCIAFIITSLILAVVFYIGFTGVGLLRKAFGKDPMHRKYDPAASSYWIQRAGADAEFEPARYEKQF